MSAKVVLTRKPEYDYTFKISILGESGVGKTGIFNCLAGKEFVSSDISTIGVDFNFIYKQVGDKSFKIQVWDTAGQERFASIAKSYIRTADVILLVYDVTDEKSFKKLDYWRNLFVDCKDDVFKILVGNKIDLEELRIVDKQFGVKYAETYGFSYFETSAKTGEKIDAVLEEALVKKFPQAFKTIDNNGNAVQNYKTKPVSPYYWKNDINDLKSDSCCNIL